MYTLRIASAGRKEQRYLALAEQVFRTHLVKNRAAVNFTALDAWKAMRGILALIQAGDDIRLGRWWQEIKMDAGCAGFPGQTDDDLSIFLPASSSGRQIHLR